MCSACGKSSKINMGQKVVIKPVKTVNRATLANRVNSPFGTPKVRISFSSRNR